MTAHPLFLPCQMNLVHALPSYFFKIQFNINLPSMSRSSKQSLSFAFPPPKPPVHSIYLLLFDLNSSASYFHKLSAYILPLTYVDHTLLLNDIIPFLAVALHCPDEQRRQIFCPVLIIIKTGACCPIFMSNLEGYNK